MFNITVFFKQFTDLSSREMTFNEKQTGIIKKRFPLLKRDSQTFNIQLKPHLHGRLFCVRFFDKNGSGKVAFSQRRL